MATSESSQFEGPEKLLEIWFAPSPTDVERATPPTEDDKCGLRKVDRAVWEEMLEVVKCKVLSVVEGSEMDAYLLRSATPLYRLRISHAPNILPLLLACYATCRLSANRRSSSPPIVSSSRPAERRSTSTDYLASSRSPAIMQTC